MASSGCATVPPTSNEVSIANGTAGFAAADTAAAQATKTATSMVEVLGVVVLSQGTVKMATRPARNSASGETIVDLASQDGLTNYISCAFPRQTIHKVVVTNHTGVVIRDVSVSTRNQVSTSVNSSAATFGLGQHIKVPPPGTSFDHQLQPKAGEGASPTAKGDAVVMVAMDKTGTPYIWGHNEDRGQRGFDCSNFIAYVYHHALGYQFSGNSNVQWDNVGVTVPIWDRRKGDLLIFEHGKHVGIYIGNDEMIQCGGGLGQVGKLSLGTDSYWGKRISGVRRMF